MANKFEIVISAVNQASGPISQVRQSVRQLGQQINGSRISNYGNMLTSAFSSSSGATSSISRFLTGTNLAAGAIAALTLKLGEMESQWASSVRSMNNLGIRTGLPTREAYGVQYAARLAGLSPEQANAGVEHLRQTYSDAVNNRNPEALKRYQNAGISTDPRHMESIESVLTKLARYAETLRNQGKYGGAQNFLSSAGASGLTDFIDQGPKRVAADLNAGDSLSPSQDDIDRGRQYADATARLSITYDKLRNTLLGAVEPELNRFLKLIQLIADEAAGVKTPETVRVRNGFERFGNILRGNGDETVEQLQQNGPVAGAMGPLDPLERLGNWIRGNGGRSNAEVALEPNANVPRAIAYFEAHGSTHEQAIGKTANLFRESSLDPTREGDNGEAYGIAQWHKDRQADFAKWAGKPIQYSSLEDQLGFVDHELHNREAAAGSALNQTTTARDAAEVVSRQFERPSDANREAAIRRQIADRLAAIYAPQVTSAQSGVDAPSPDVAKAQRPVAPTVDDPQSSDQPNGGPVGRGERMKIEIVHRNPPKWVDVSVSGTNGVDTTLTTDRQETSTGGQYAYSPGNF